MKKIKEMFRDHVNSEEYIKRESPEEIKEAEKAFENSIKRLNTKTRLEIDDLAAACCTAYEEQGFIDGFNLAVQIMTDCGFSLKKTEEVSC